MNKLRIRTFSIYALLLILLLPWIFFVASRLIETKSFSIGSNVQPDQAQQSIMSETIRLIETNFDKWTDNKWQNQMHNKLRQANMDVIILSASDQEIYRSNPDRNHAFKSSERFSLIEDGQMLGKVVIYLPNSYTNQMIASIAGLLLAFFIVGVEMRRFLLKPLERMGLAARQIAAGEWDVQLPKSGIAEIAEVRDAFKMMVNGLLQSNRKREELEEERRFVIAAIAHDLRTPLFALRGYLDGLEQGIAQSPEKMAKYLAVCKEKSAQLDRLVEDLFTFAKLEYLEKGLNNKTVDLKLILKNSIDSLSPIAQQKHISVDINNSADDCYIIGDSHLLERAMVNLLDNAVRHTPFHGKILVQINRDGHKVTFTIQDTGTGFTSEELQRAFEPLYRGEESRNRSTGGAGLGLTISQRIISRHGGQLAVDNHPAGGALLSGWIPANNNLTGESLETNTLEHP